MRKLIIWIAAICVVVVAADLLFGLGARYYIKNHTLGGDYLTTDYLIKNSDSIDDLVVLGSSVALNSINTRLLSDSLNISAYNGGANGQTFPFYLSLLEIISQKPQLKTVILGMKEESLCDSGLGQRYNFLMPYYKTGHEGIDKRIEGDSKLNALFLKSSLYRYNTIWFRILLYNFFEPGIKGDCGFVAKDIPSYFPKKEVIETSALTVTDERVAEFEQFVKICKDRGIKLIVSVPPRYEQWNSPNSGELFLRKRAGQGDFVLWFDAYDTPVSQDSTYFYDNSHLNYKGADLYTGMIIERLKNHESEL